MSSATHLGEAADGGCEPRGPGQDGDHKAVNVFYLWLIEPEFDCTLYSPSSIVHAFSLGARCGRPLTGRPMWSTRAKHGLKACLKHLGTIIGSFLIIYHSPLPHTYALSSLHRPPESYRPVLHAPIHAPLPRLFILISIHPGSIMRHFPLFSAEFEAASHGRRGCRSGGGRARSHPEVGESK